MSRPLFALIDCNNFFVSCERIFRPDLEGKPVVVLSSNDGCAVARSNEAKALGIPMGAPAFKYKQLFKEQGVVKFSANFELYGNISRRITSILTEITPRTEVYSIDESFLDLSALDIRDYTAWGKTLRSRLLKEVGMPVSIGIAPSKTLAKLASDTAKKQERTEGVLNLVGAPLDIYLGQFAVEDIWGVGHRLAPALRARGVNSALDLARMNPRLAQQLMGIHGRQMVYELNANSCLPLERIHSIRKSIARTRTFGEDTSRLHVVESAIASFAAQAAYRLRSSGQLTRRAGLFLTTSRHKPGYRTWTREIKYETPTADSGLLMQTLTSALAKVYEPNQFYHRAGVWLYDFVPDNRLQADLIGHINVEAFEESKARMQALDNINSRFGKRTVYYAAEDLAKSWQPQRKIKSPAYTTNWDELPRVRLIT